MVVDYLFRAFHAAVTDLDVVSVEDFSELVVLFVYWGQEFVSGTGVFTKRRVVPEDVVTLSVFPFTCFG